MNNVEHGGRELHELEKTVKPTIRLEIFRHDQPAPASSGEADEQRRLTQAGREHAQQVGKAKNPNPEMGLAYGSPRDRAQETAYRQLLANEAFVNSESSFDDIKAEVDKSLAYGNKLIVSEGLNYSMDKNSEYAAAAGKAYSHGRLLEFLVTESDDLAKRLKDTRDYSYSRSAANVAKIVQKYVGISPVWERVYNQNEEKYKDNTEMQRFLGTHQTIGETFLLKVIEKTQGKQAALDFIQKMPDKGGFGLSEGYSVRIIPYDDGTKIVVSYQDQQWEITPPVIAQIVQEGESVIEDAEK